MGYKKNHKLPKMQSEFESQQVLLCFFFFFFFWCIQTQQATWALCLSRQAEECCTSQSFSRFNFAVIPPSFKGTQKGNKKQPPPPHGFFLGMAAPLIIRWLHFCDLRKEKEIKCFLRINQNKYTYLMAGKKKSSEGLPPARSFLR